MFDIEELREVTAYDELELDTLGDEKTALFLIMSDTDDSFNFLISMCYGMIDGIINNGPKQPTVAELEQQAHSGQPISLMDLADAVHRERQEKKKSVVEQLHSQPTQETKKTAPKRSAEREL